MAEREESAPAELKEERPEKEGPVKDRSRTKKLAGFWIRAVCFSLIVVLLLAYANFVFTPKHDYGICSMMTYYRQEEDTIDVLTIGTSLAYAGINTNVLWKEYGIAAYNLCSAEQPFWVSYYTLQEALKTQHPKLILLDAKPANYKRDYSKRGRTILSTYGIRDLRNRIHAILACVETPQDATSYILGLPEVHSNYKKLEAGDFTFPPDNGGRGDSWKGYIESDLIEAHEKPSVKWNSTKRDMNSREEEYARKIFELAQKENTQVVLIGLPNPDYANDHLYYNALWAIAKRYGVTGINYNHPDNDCGLQYETDFADWQHLNVQGSIKFSRKLGADLRDKYGIPDRRGDPGCESWEECARLWYEKYPAFVSSGGILLDWYAEPETSREATKTLQEESSEEGPADLSRDSGLVCPFAEKYRTPPA